EELSGGKGLKKPSGYQTDNPGGEWTLDKQRRADEDIAAGRMKGTGGSTTATAGMNKELYLPVSELKKLKGVMDENPRAGSPKFDSLDKSVREKGYTNENPVMIRVNHKGEAYINEGNNRVAVASKYGEPKIKVWVQWQN